MCPLRGKLQSNDHTYYAVFGVFSLLSLGHRDGEFETHPAYNISVFRPCFCSPMEVETFRRAELSSRNIA
jgi:hypothetical protein